MTDSMHAVMCRSCGGSVSHAAGAPMPRCLFCGRDALEPTEVPGVEPPEAYLPFVLSEAEARQAFRGWAKRRFWAPASIRRARVELSRLFLPAWTWSGELETHWAALVPAATRSGKRPVTGQERRTMTGVLIPSSPTLAGRELAAIAPFAERSATPLVGDPPGPFELGTLTRAVAEEAGVQGLLDAHGAHIAAEIGASRMRTSCVTHQLHGRPLLLPIWIGAYLHGEQSYRVVINGQSAAIVGKAPVSWGKVAAAVVAVLALAATVLVIAAGS